MENKGSQGTKIQMGSLRANAAMEYLVTYGWAIFGMFLVIAFLVGSGVFNPNRFVSEECTLQPGLVCTSYYMQRYSDAPPRVVVSFNVTNTMGFPVGIRSYSATIRGTMSTQCLQPGTCAYYLAQGQSQRLTIVTDTLSPYSGPDVVRSVVNVTYTSCQGLDRAGCLNPAADLPLHQTSGRLVARVRG